jgi:hypothetical protein
MSVGNFCQGRVISKDEVGKCWERLGDFCQGWVIYLGEIGKHCERYDDIWWFFVKCWKMFTEGWKGLGVFGEGSKIFEEIWKIGSVRYGWGEWMKVCWGIMLVRLQRDSYLSTKLLVVTASESWQRPCF